MKILTLYILAVVAYLAFEVCSGFRTIDQIKADPHHCAVIAEPGVQAACWAGTESEGR